MYSQLRLIRLPQRPFVRINRSAELTAVDYFQKQEISVLSDVNFREMYQGSFEVPKSKLDNCNITYFNENILILLNFLD